jgi:hypothetical protein
MIEVVAAGVMEGKQRPRVYQPLHHLQAARPDRGADDVRGRGVDDDEENLQAVRVLRSVSV